MYITVWRSVRRSSRSRPLLLSIRPLTNHTPPHSPPHSPSDSPVEKQNKSYDGIESRNRLLSDQMRVINSESPEFHLSTRQKIAVFLSANMSLCGSMLYIYTHSNEVLTPDNLALGLLVTGIGGIATVYMQSKTIYGITPKKKSKFDFELLNAGTAYAPEMNKLATVCGDREGKIGGSTIVWPDDVQRMINDLKAADSDRLNTLVSERVKSISERLKNDTFVSAKDAEAALAPRAFVLYYEDGLKIPERRKFIRSDSRLSRAELFGEEISLILSCATRHDTVIINLESPGGSVIEYGLAASHILRLKRAGLRTIVTVDKIAASGGFMMACCADEIVAAPFALIGSIGVVAEVPNINKVLTKNDVDYLTFTAGKFKRTVTMFGKNSEEGVAHFQSQLEEIHTAFKTHVGENRGDSVDIDSVSTGETWLAAQCRERGLVDRLGTSWDVTAEFANSGYDVVKVTRKKEKDKLWSYLKEDMEETSLYIKNMFESIFPIGVTRAAKAANRDIPFGASDSLLSIRDHDYKM